jgi:hypothetical protein
MPGAACVKQVETKKTMKSVWKNKPTNVPVYVVDGGEVHPV